MAFQTPITIKRALSGIAVNRYVLPAIQREFVWRRSQIEGLFDSLMRGYPIGSFLFWQVAPESAKDYRFYQFITNYDQRKPHNPVLGAPSMVPGLTAVLDGQQRLTALNVGLNGSASWKLARRHWNKPQNFPKRRLYLNLLAPRTEDEQEPSYRFRLLREDNGEAQRRNDHEHWYRVGRILKVEDASHLIDVVRDLGLEDTREPQRVLTRLHHVVHSDGVISAYEEERQNPERVLRIFVRANSGGTALSHSDMLLSMAVAQWDNVDARQEIHALVDEIGRIGFSVSHVFVLKACLMIGDSDSIRYKVENFRKSKIGALQDQWNHAKETIRETAELARELGYSRESLTSTNALLPIAYFLHHRQRSSRLSADDREAIRRWLIRSLLKRGVWSSGADGLLTAIRKAIRESAPRERFPAQAIEAAMSARGKGLTFDDEELGNLADARYDGRAYSLLFLLYDFVDTTRNLFHVDHVFARVLMKPERLRRAGVDEERIFEYRDRVNRLANLQLLEGKRNMEKGGMAPADWLGKMEEKKRRQHCLLHDLGDVPADVRSFADFYQARRTRILEKLRGLLGRDSA